MSEEILGCVILQNNNILYKWSLCRIYTRKFIILYPDTVYNTHIISVPGTREGVSIE